jgi:hypothetical protein
MLLLSLAACSSVLGPVDADDARRWAEFHETTLGAVHRQAQELLAALPSLPGDRFFCRETIAPPGMSEASGAALQETLCRQQEAAWRSERHEAEEALGVKLLNGAFQRFGVAGVSLSIAGPDAVEWADSRGIWEVGGGEAVAPSDPGALAWGEGEAGRIGWGQVTLGDGAEPAGEPVWAIEWRSEVERREAAATVRLVLLAEGTPDAAFVRRSVGSEDEPPPVRIPVLIP